MHITKGKADWIDVLNPTEEDLGWLKDKFRIHDLILRELKQPSARSKVEAYDNYLFLVYYFPSYDEKEQTSRRREIDFIITRHQVITVHYDKLEPFLDAETDKAQNSLELAHLLITSLLTFEERQLSHIRQTLEEIGNRLFKNREKDILRKISRLKRDISDYRIIVRHQVPLLESLFLRGSEFWGPDARTYLNDLIGVGQRIVNQIEDYREAVSDFEDTNTQIMNLKINSVMKTFTILSFLTFPFVLFATVVSMQVGGNPFTHLPNAYWYLLGFMAITLVALAIYVIRKKWL